MKNKTNQIEERKKIIEIGSKSMEDFVGDLSTNFLDHCKSLQIKKVIDLSEIDFTVVKNQRFLRKKFLQEAKEFLEENGFTENNSTFLETFPKDFKAPYEKESNPKTLQEVEKEVIQSALNRHRGKRRDAAEELGISERILYRKIKEYNLF